MARIHPTALVAEGAELGEDVEVGPFSILEAGVRVGDGCLIGPRVVIHSGTTVGPRCTIDAGTALGGDAQHLRAAKEDTFLEIGEDNVIREYVTIHRSAVAGGVTRVGCHNLLMGFVHLGHDTVVGDHTTLTNLVTVGGHCHIDDRAVIGGMTAVHQKVRIGRLAMVGGMSGVNQDVPPYSLVEGNPARVRGVNIVGLRRNDVAPATRAALKHAVRTLFCSKRNRGLALEELEAWQPMTPELRDLIDFVKATRDGQKGRQLER